MYIKNRYDFEINFELSQTNPKISESLFVELKRPKNPVIGCVYRYHSGIPIFLEIFFKNALEVVSKQPNKICALMGD